MDAVITYVNGNDPQWQEVYCRTTGIPALTKRYRDWGTLRYLFRGIEQYLPFVEKVYLVVAMESQVPSWVNRSVVRVVTHPEIIPTEYLPTFNSTTIEMFLYRIPGLSEQFLYFNDDCFPVMDCAEEDFFPEGRIATGFSRHLFAFGMYKKQTRNADRLARKAAGVRPGLSFIRPQHTCTPMLRSAFEDVFQREEKAVLNALSALREPKNLNQYLFTDYLYFTGRAVSRRLSNKHVSLAAVTPEQLRAILQKPTRKLVCINDVRLSESQATAVRNVLLDAFETCFPEKSRFES